MKFIYTSLLPFVAKVSADFAAISEGLAQLKAISENKTESEYLAEKAANGDRALEPALLSVAAPIDGYGCWCNFNANYHLSKGPVQDHNDAICKTLINGYHCGIIDGVEAGQPCDTPTVAYNAYNYFANFGDPVIQVCEGLNQGTCERTACIVEGQFTFDFFTGFINQSPNDPNLKHSNNLFDPSTECTYAGGAGPSDKTCCGAYPNRYPYKTFSGGRDCCGQVTFDTTSLQCCTNPIDTSIKTTLSIFDTCPT